MRVCRPVMCLVGLFCLAVLFGSGTLLAQSADSAPAEQGKTVLKTTVRRVVLDVVVTDSKGAPVPGLTKDDFTVKEDAEPQRVLSFDTSGFSADMDFVPPKLPPQPPNTFINMPSTPEKGPLYALLYDMVNLDDPSQMMTPEDHSQQVIARKQMMRFIQNKPEGARFALFVRSDGLHLVQGFTADKQVLLAALDPAHPRPHVPVVFLMGANYGRGNRLGAMDILHSIAAYLDGMPGRKNLIWFSSQFPLALFAQDTDGPNFQEETKATLELLAKNQIAVYPVDARGVSTEDSHASVGTGVHSSATSGTENVGGPGGSGGAANAGGGSSPSAGADGSVQGESAVNGSYNVMDGIARETGGQAFYGDNDVAAELVKATEGGRVYYTLTYAPSDVREDGKLRNVEVSLDKRGYTLAYRRSYYSGAAGTAADTEVPAAEATTPSGRPQVAKGPVNDTLAAEMQHGAPVVHQLVFVVQAQQAGTATQATAAEMAELATEPAYFKSRRRSASAKPLPPVPLQKVVFNFEVPTRQFAGEPVLDLEVAAAVYDADGRMMNGFVRVAKKELAGGGTAAEAARFFRVEQELAVPAGASSVRLAVRDTANDRIGAMEVPLPLAPGTATQARAH